ncbi:MAG: type II secretion system protein M [Deltaproteobacteria bacterium]|nr:type II secretion system protein M [Deltaproteobacteria bacterium]
MARLGDKIENLMAGWQRLSQRERLMVGGVAVALVAFIGFFVHMWFSSSLTSMDKQIAGLTEKLQTIIDMRSEYEAAKQEQKLAQARMRKGAQIDLKATVEHQAEQLGVHIEDMKTSAPNVDTESRIKENRVTVNIELITIDRLVDFLAGIERSSSTVAVRKLRVKNSFKQPDHLEVSFTVSNFQLLEEGPEEAKAGPAKKAK